MPLSVHTVRLFTLLSISVLGCRSNESNPRIHTTEKRPTVKQVPYDSTHKVVHVFVALCDNKHQGIHPVPPAIGNGQDPNSNLYWGCDAGVRTYFKRSQEWQLVRKYRIDSVRLERLIFKHRTQPWFLVADAYDGRSIKQCTIDFLNSCSGEVKDTLRINGLTLGIGGNARLLAYIGHDGLMDFSLSKSFRRTDSVQRDAIVLACISKKYFRPFLAYSGARPLIWTTGLMCPEAYTLHDALGGYIKNAPPETVRELAVKAYAKNQRCSVKAARNLLVSGF